MIGLVVAFVAGCLVTFGVLRALGARGPRTPVAPAGGAVRVAEAVTVYGEELESLAFDPASPGATAAMIADYQAALDCYEQAKAAPVGDEPEIARALDRGRAALVRLSARIDGRPIPIEALESALAPAPPVLVSEDRYLHSGTAPGEFDVLVDRPEPGSPVIADIAFEGQGNFFVRPLTRTEGRLTIGQTLVNFQRAYQGRHLVDTSVTHLRVEVKNSQGPCRWSVRLLPVDRALSFTGEAHGSTAHEVLAHTGGRVRIAVQARTTGTWRVTYRAPRRDSGTDWIHGLGDGFQDLVVPAAGWILVQVPDGGSWSLQTVPVSH